MKRILITGGAGYIGQVLSQRLLDTGYQVTVLDNLYYNQHPPFHLSANPRFLFTYGDVRRAETLVKAIDGQDAIIHLAALVGAPICQQKPQEALDLNYGAVELLDICRHKDQLIIFPNTNSGYGSVSEGVCTEEMPLNPLSLYGTTKRDAEAHLLQQPNTICLRLATVFGVSPRMRLDLLVNDFTYRAYKDGYLVLYEPYFMRNYIHIQDVARCFQFCLDNSSKMVGQTFNVGMDDANCSKEELALKIQKHLPKLKIYYGEGEDVDKRNYIVSNEKLRKAGFKATRGLDLGIEQLIRSFSMMGRGQYGNA